MHKVYFKIHLIISKVALNSRDRHEKNGNQNLQASKLTLQKAILKKSQLKCISDAIITLH